jgi:hypothetical protein
MTHRKSHDVWWGTGRGDLAEALRELHRLGVRPTLFAIEYAHNWDDNRNDIAQCAKFFAEYVKTIEAAAPRRDPLFADWAGADISRPRLEALTGQLHQCISADRIMIQRVIQDQR